MSQLLTTIEKKDVMIMLPKNRIPTHPGEILLNEFLLPLGMSQMDFARHINVPIQRVNEIVHAKRGITPQTAWLFAQALNTTPEFWVNLQSAYDLARSQPSERIAVIHAIAERSNKYK